MRDGVIAPSGIPYRHDAHFGRHAVEISETTPERVIGQGSAKRCCDCDQGDSHSGQAQSGTLRGVHFSMPWPLQNRFVHLDLEASLDDWCNWAIKSGMRPEIIAFLRFKPELFACGRDDLGRKRLAPPLLGDGFLCAQGALRANRGLLCYPERANSRLSCSTERWDRQRPQSSSRFSGSFANYPRLTTSCSTRTRRRSPRRLRRRSQSQQSRDGSSRRLLTHVVDCAMAAWDHLIR